jgi:hypothetical protein
MEQNHQLEPLKYLIYAELAGDEWQSPRTVETEIGPVE